MKLAIFGAFLLVYSVSIASGQSDDYLKWTEKYTTETAQTWRAKGRVGGLFDGRILSTDKAFNYKLRATLMTPEMIRAAARLEQLRNGLSVDETKQLVAAAEKEDQLVVMIEIDPREGSGIIPNDWRALLYMDGNPVAARGVKRPELRDVTVFKGVFSRDYDYDIFWVSFPLKNSDGAAVWSEIPGEVELVVGIYKKEGRVSWKLSAEARRRIGDLLKIK